jgi:hypothetical protein
MFGKDRLLGLYTRGVASVSLVHAWKLLNAAGRKHSAVDLIDRRFIWFLIFLMSLCAMSFDLLFFSKELIPTWLAGAWLVSGLGLMFVALRLAFGADFDQALIKDLEELERLSKSNVRYGTMSEAELRSAAKEMLVDLARSIVSLQNTAGTLYSLDSCWTRAEGIKEREFKPLHALFLRFGLVEKEWDSFFDGAKAGQQSTVTTPAS